MEEAAGNCSFVVKDLADLSVEQAKNVLISSFAEKGPFSTSKVCGHPEHKEDESLGDYVDELWSLYLPTSFGLVDRDGQVVALSVMSDLYDSSRMDLREVVARHGSNYMDEVMMYLEHLTQKATPLLPTCDESGIIMSREMTGIKLNEFTPVENFYIMFLAVREQHRRAKQHGYQYSVAESAHLYSQALSRYFGCEELFLDHPCDYVNAQGRKPFACVNKKIVVNYNLKKY